MGVIEQKLALDLKILYFSKIFEKYLVSGFAMLLELRLKMVELDSA